jgi:hypothetical protein
LHFAEAAAARGWPHSYVGAVRPGRLERFDGRRFKCSDSMFVSLWLFVTRDEADAWATNTALVNR